MTTLAAALAPTTTRTPLPIVGHSAAMLARPVSGGALAALAVPAVPHPHADPLAALGATLTGVAVSSGAARTITHGGGSVRTGGAAPATVARVWSALAGDRDDAPDTRSMCPTRVERDGIDTACGAPRMAGRATCKRHGGDRRSPDPTTLTRADALALARPVSDVSRGDTRDGAAIVRHAPLAVPALSRATRTGGATAWPIPVDHPSRKGSAATFGLTGAAGMLSTAPLHPPVGVMPDDDADTLAHEMGDDAHALARITRALLWRDVSVRMPAADAAAVLSQSAGDVAADAALILAAMRAEHTHAATDADPLPIPLTSERRAARDDDDADALAARGWSRDGDGWVRVPRPLWGVRGMRHAAARDAVRRGDRYGVCGSRGSGVRATDTATIVTWDAGPDGSGGRVKRSQTLAVGDSTAPRQTGGALHIGVSTLRTAAPTDGDTLARALAAVPCPRLRSILAVPAKGRQTASVLRDAYTADTGRSPRNAAALDRWIDAARVEWERVAAMIDTLRDATGRQSAPDPIDAAASGLTIV